MLIEIIKKFCLPVPTRLTYSILLSGYRKIVNVAFSLHAEWS